MKANDPLDRLLQAAARAQRAETAEPLRMPLGWETRVLSSTRRPSDLFAFAPLFRAAFACATAVAILCAGLHFRKTEQVNLYESALDYSVAAAYLQ